MSHMRITGNRSILYLSADDFAMQSFVQYLASFTGILTEMHCLDDMHRKKTACDDCICMYNTLYTPIAPRINITTVKVTL